MTKAKNLKVSIELDLCQLECLHALVSKEYQRIARESPCAFVDNPGSWADSIDRLRNCVNWARDNNLEYV